MKKSNKISYIAIGWREWVALPQLDISKIKAKVDTGARSSSLHAYDLRYYRRGQKEFVKFKVHPMQRNNKKVIQASAEVLEYRNIKSSNGSVQKRPVVVTPVEIAGERWLIEITLANRDEMGFRMLLGRESVRGKVFIDPGKSFLTSPKKRKSTR